MEHGDRIPTSARRALTLALLAVQLLVFTLGAALADQGRPRGAAGNRAIVVATTTTADGSARPAASSDPRVERVARARGDRVERIGGAPPLDLGLPLDVQPVTGAALSGSIDWRSSARDHRQPPSVVHGARGPPRA